MLRGRIANRPDDGVQPEGWGLSAGQVFSVEQGCEGLKTLAYILRVSDTVVGRGLHLPAGGQGPRQGFVPEG